MSSMLEQAMVDATALRDAALKKAEAAVLEESKPKVEEALKALLEQEEDELGDLLGGGGPAEPDMGPGEVSGVADTLSLGVTAGENMCPCPEEEEEIEIDFGELERQMAADEQAGEMGQDDLAQDLNLTPPGDEIDIEMGPEGEEEEEEIDLDEDVLAALMENGDAVEAISEEKEHEGDCEHAHAGMTHAEWTHKGNLEENTGEVEEAKMSADMLAQASRDAHLDYMKSQGAQKKPDKPTPRHKSMGQEFELDPGDDSSLELAREGKVIVSKEKLMEIVRSVTKDLFTKQAKNLSNLQEENNKLKNFVRRLSDELKETNLQNARLLYQSQILESVSLNERQKAKIVEAVSKAGSVEEAKVIYETLIHSVGTSGKKRKPKSLNEVVEKRSTPLIARSNKSEKASNSVKERMQKLAGIK